MLVHMISFAQFNSILSTYSKCTINLPQAGVQFTVGCKECWLYSLLVSPQPEVD